MITLAEILEMEIIVRGKKLFARYELDEENGDVMLYEVFLALDKQCTNDLRDCLGDSFCREIETEIHVSATLKAL